MAVRAYEVLGGVADAGAGERRAATTPSARTGDQHIQQSAVGDRLGLLAAHSCTLLG
jgi:hypothetical protein